MKHASYEDELRPIILSPLGRDRRPLVFANTRKEVGHAASGPDSSW